MRVFLGLREAELSQAMLRHPGADRVDHRPLGVGGGHEAVVILGVVHHPQHGQVGPVASVEFVELRLTQRAQDLARTVGAEVQAEKNPSPSCMPA